MDDNLQYPPIEQTPGQTTIPQHSRRNEESPRRNGFIRGWLEFVVMVVVALLITWGLKTFVITPYEIPTGSMEPTIAIGNRVLSEKISYYGGTPEPGDIVTFEDPTGENATLIKRCIAVAGQTVDLRDGTVYVDDVPQDEWYTHGKRSDPLAATMPGTTVTFPYTVPEGSIWVMGDNRTNSADSRYFGAIPASSVSGRAVFTYWPLSEFGALD